MYIDLNAYFKGDLDTISIETQDEFVDFIGDNFCVDGEEWETPIHFTWNQYKGEAYDAVPYEGTYTFDGTDLVEVDTSFLKEEENERVENTEE